MKRPEGTPRLIEKAQRDMIRVLAKASNSEIFVKKIPEAIEVLRGYVERIRRDGDIRDLIIAKQLSMHPDRYAYDVFQTIAAKQLMKEGMEISAGQTVRYLITDAENRMPNKRVKAVELINAENQFDVKYLGLLMLAGGKRPEPIWIC